MTDGQPIPVIIDCDTGVDDALALLFAVRHPALDVRAITCVAGNTDVDGVVRNTLTVLEQAGAPHIPVAPGAGRPGIAAPPAAPRAPGRRKAWKRPTRTWLRRAGARPCGWRAKAVRRGRATVRW